MKIKALADLPNKIPSIALTKALCRQSHLLEVVSQEDLRGVYSVPVRAWAGDKLELDITHDRRLCSTGLVSEGMDIEAARLVLFCRVFREPRPELVPVSHGGCTYRE